MMKSNPKLGKKQNARGDSRSRKKTRSVLIVLFVIALLAVGIQLLFRHHPVHQGESVVGSELSSTARNLSGRWIRPDGGYVLDIRKVNPGGNIEVAYFNPRPIHVAKAEASQVDQATRVFIELQDVGYPGSTYTLVYDPGADQLKGIYYQAALQQNFDVVFVRMK